MTDLPRPDDATLLRVQKAEIDRLNDSRIFLLAVVEEIRAEAETEIGRLSSLNSLMRSRLPEEALAEVDALAHGSESARPTP